MDQVVYRDVRTKFKAICEAQNIIKKTISGPEVWDAAKHELIRETMHLRGVFWDPENTDLKKLALDLICGDVTKTMREAARKMPVPQARTILGLNPEQSRSIRLAFHVMLRAQHFVCKRLIPDDEWKELKQRWITQTPILEQLMMSTDPADPVYAQKVKALEVLCRDAMRRYIDWQKRGIDPLAKPQTPSAEPETEDTEDGQDVAGTTENLEGEFQASRFLMDDSLGLHEVTDADVARVSQVSMTEADTPIQGKETQADGSEAPPKRKRGRPRKVPEVRAGEIVQAAEGPSNNQPQPAAAPAPKKRGRPTGTKPASTRQVKRVPGKLIWLSKNEARFVPIDEADQILAATSGPGTTSTQPRTPSPATTARQQLTLLQERPPTQPQPSPQPQIPAAQPQQQQPQAPLPDFLHLAAPSDRLPVSTSPSTTQAPASALPSAPSAPAGSTIAVYFRIHPSTTIIYGLPMWITTMSVQSLDEVKAKAVARYPAARCALVEGIVKDGMGGEVPLSIPGDEELKAYLDHVKETRGAPTFNVQLVNGWQAR
jgi:hypothetical protein